MGFSFEAHQEVNRVYNPTKADGFCLYIPSEPLALYELKSPKYHKGSLDSLLTASEIYGGIYSLYERTTYSASTKVHMPGLVC
jgi:hypothetical protein